MNLLSSILNAKPAAAPAPAAPTVVPTGILPPEAPKTAAESFQAVPPPRKTPPMPIPGRKLVIQEPAPEVVAPPPPVAASTLPQTVAVDTAGETAVVEAPKKRGRPPGAKNKSTAADTLPPGSTGTGGIAQAVQNHLIDTAEASLTVRSITVTRSATVQVVQFEPMRIDVSVTADVAGLTVAEATHILDQQVMSELVRRMEQLHEAKRDAGVLKAQGK